MLSEFIPCWFEFDIQWCSFEIGQSLFYVLNGPSSGHWEAKSNCQHASTRAAKNLRNANLNLASKIEIFWGFNLKKPQITDLEKPQRMNPQPQKGWPHPRLKFWGFLRIALKPKFLRILGKPRILSYFWAVFKGFFTNFFEVFRGSSKNLKNLDLILTSSFEVYWG